MNIEDFKPYEQFAWSEVEDFPWNDWKECALDAGLSEEFSSVGRSVMREAFQHSWNDELSKECGWKDNGREMIAQAKVKPDQTLARWQHLLETDGLYLEG